jgi:mitogen-activated protein kinase organizer 1
LINIIDGPIHALIYSRDGQYVLSASADRSIKLWNPSTGLCIKTYNGHGKDVMGIALPLSAADNTRFVSCSIDRAVIMWDVVSGKPIRRFAGHQARVNAVDLNADASIIASGSYDSSVKLWDCKSNNRAPIQVLEDAKDSIESISIAQNEIMTR